MKRNAIAAALILCAAACDNKPRHARESKTAAVIDAAAPVAAIDAAAAPGPTAADAKAFITDVDAKLRVAWAKRDVAAWNRETNITAETKAAAAAADQEARAYVTQAIAAAQKFTPVLGNLDPDTQRMFHLLRIADQTAPADPARAAELSQVLTEMDSTYGEGKVCDGGKCQDLGQLEDVLKDSHDPKVLLAAWKGWHDTVGHAERPLYLKFVPLANEGVQQAGFKDLSELWLSGYDMPPDQMVAEADRLWGQVQPLYKDLHCYVRRKLSERYGAGVVPATGPMPAHMLGNMWAQTWGNVYPMVEPYPGASAPDVSKTLVAQHYDATRMVKLAESFFVSLGMPQLPQTFWERSMLTQPKGKEVVCHASAWDPTWSGDARIKVCVKIDQEDLITLHHELGHDYYYLSYYQLPILFQNGANDGFHEAIGDTIALSVTPQYLHDVGLLDKVATDDKATINQQMYVALDKVAFLPFGLLVDKWRWEAFSGAVKPEQWNDRWWQLRLQYQGIAPPVARSADDFDPGAKYHVPSNTPYLRYFLATILQFQFHRALCQAAGWKGPLYQCSIHGSKEAGQKFAAMLEMGARKPWPDALEALTGQRQMDASAILEYFAPLDEWLKQQNQGQTCGW